MSRDVAFLIEKVISIPLVLAAVFLLSPTELLTTFIVLGHGHFFIAYLYQYRAGKITPTYSVAYLFVFATLLFALFQTKRLDILIVTAGIVFLAHFLQDEVMLAGKKPALMRTLEMTPIMLLYIGFLIHRVMHIRLLPEIAIAATLIIAAYVIFLIVRKQRPDYLSGYFLAIITLLLGLVANKTIPPIQVLLGSLILLHYSSWYIAYFLKVRGDGARRRSYITAVLGCNAVALILYGLFLLPDGRRWLGFLFLPAYFYVWTLMHTLFSIRWNDWRGMLSR